MCILRTRLLQKKMGRGVGMEPHLLSFFFHSRKIDCVPTMCWAALGTRAMEKPHGACILMEETDRDTFKCNMFDSDKYSKCKLNRIRKV